MTSIPLHRVAVLRPFAQFLADVGAPVERGFRRAGLPYTALENADNYVPSQRFRSFVVNMAYREGIEDLGFHVGRRFGAESADPHMVDRLRKSPTLYRGLLEICELVNKTVFNSRMGVTQAPDRNCAHVFHRPSSYKAHDGSAEQLGWFGLLALIDTTRMFAGPGWQPSEIGLVAHRPPRPSICEQFPETRIRLSQPYAYMTLEYSQLTLPPMHRGPAPTDSAALSFAGLADDFAAALKQTLDAYVLESDLSLEFAASLCCMSHRSLQRRLSAAGTTYSELAAEVRFRTASRMLLDPSLMVTDVAHLLSYTDAGNFSRAFRRMSGLTPQMYRRAHLTPESAARN